MNTIDLTPSWETAVQIYMMVLEDGSEEGKIIARKDILRLARAYDARLAKKKKVAS